ncbi:invasion associated locus B family protein [Pseudochrobactrum sp. Wa41.01b-1]|uniref:invasion associated locus B family protein n=1 Tax=Pseudochrobactrum sp. Wa41.01b-1 TaxID=2864102 RepID=UPI001C692861|nr:invasion associated locus B family protein [Pseudochrobactrum sp. Wa41.01b-1]QYM72582.1 invasion associated locus B family protein [Pseudochrobactrum sp. Wa41.01b-1]
MNNKNILRIISGTVIVLILNIISVSAATGLPGGASSLSETYGNWTVSCLVQKQDEAQKVLCSMSQQQVDDKRQRALAVEISPDKSGASGVFVLPFGLNLSAGAVLQIDETTADKAVAFSTCLPAGCIVPASFDTAKTDALSKGQNLSVLIQSADGKDLKLAVPLDGFASAIKRTRELLK